MVQTSNKVAFGIWNQTCKDVSSWAIRSVLRSWRVQTASLPSRHDLDGAWNLYQLSRKEARSQSRVGPVPRPANSVTHQQIDLIWEIWFQHPKEKKQHWRRSGVWWKGRVGQVSCSKRYLESLETPRRTRDKNKKYARPPSTEEASSGHKKSCPASLMHMLR